MSVILLNMGVQNTREATAFSESIPNVTDFPSGKRTQIMIRYSQSLLCSLTQFAPDRVGKFTEMISETSLLTRVFISSWNLTGAGRTYNLVVGSGISALFENYSLWIFTRNWTY